MTAARKQDPPRPRRALLLGTLLAAAALLPGPGQASVIPDEFGLRINPVMDPHFDIDGSPWWDVEGGAQVQGGILLLPAGGRASQEFPGASVIGLGGVPVFVDVGAVRFVATGTGTVTLTLIDPETGIPFVALDAPFSGTGGTVQLPLPATERIARSTPLLLELAGTGSGAALDDVELDEAAAAAQPAPAPPDADGDEVPDDAESDLSDGHSVLILPQGVILDAGQTHVVPSRGVFTFDVQVYRYPTREAIGAPLALDLSRGAAFTLFDAENFVVGMATGRDFVNERGFTFWHSGDHPGSIRQIDATTLRVRVHAADLPALADAGELRGLGAWAYYDVADDDHYMAPYGPAEPSSDFYSVARNAVRDLAIADAMPLAATPLVLTLPPLDVDDDGFSNVDEIAAAVTLEQALDAPFNPDASPLDRDGDGFNNTEEDRNNNGVIEPHLFETDPDDASSFPLPEIQLAHSPTAPHEGDLVRFWANVSYAAPLAPPGGHVVSITWDFGDGHAGSGATPTHAYDDARAYTVRVFVRENHGQTNTTTMTVTVVNIPPVASFVQSPASGVTQRTPVTYTSTSTDADGTIVARGWTVDGAPAGNGATLTHSFTSDGPHTVCHDVADDKGALASVCAQTIVENIAPTAAFSYVSTVAPAGVPAATRTLQFTSTADDTPGDIVAWQWTFGADGTGTGPAPAFAFPTAGPRDVCLKVTDDDGAFHERCDPILVRALPAAAFTWTPTVPDDRTLIQYTDATTHPDGTAITQWEWQFGDGATSTQRHPTHQYADDGEYDVRLVARDALGVASDPLTRRVTITNIAPQASFTVPAGEFRTSAPVTFTDTSTDVDGAPVAIWDWSFGDGATSTTKNPSHTYASHPGTLSKDYVVTLRVRDDDGEWSAPAARTITVLQDTDGDGNPDVRDPDDDNDGYSDALEQSHGTSTVSAASRPVDTDGDGIPDDDTPGFTGDTDDDNDGATDAEEISAGSDPKSEASTPNDFDGDRVPNLADSTLGRNAGNPAAHRDPCFPFAFTAGCPPIPVPGDADHDGVPDAVEQALCSRQATADAINSDPRLGRCVSQVDYKPPVERPF